MEILSEAALIADLSFLFVNKIKQIGDYHDINIKVYYYSSPDVALASLVIISYTTPSSLINR